MRLKRRFLVNLLISHLPQLSTMEICEVRDAANRIIMMRNEAEERLKVEIDWSDPKYWKDLE